MAGPSDLLIGESDGFAADFTYYVAPITGTLAATEIGTDTVAIIGALEVEGALAASETGADIAAFAVDHTPIIGSLAAMEAGADIAVFVGVVSISGLLAAIETGVDVAALSAGHLVSEANWTLVGSGVNAVSLNAMQMTSMTLRGRM